MIMSNKLTQNIGKIFIYIILFIGLILILFPLYITIVTALKTPAESAQSFFSLPGGLYLENFKKVIEKAHFFSYVKNSVIITVLSLLGEIIIVPAFAYAISRNKDKWYFKIIYIMTIV
ncbi:MAG TPA: sugar ABC transporter permease, partial [Spirochaeta sp.]|nr:sugar ABC transporter permease [Spirochaeta sp.]